MRATFVGATSAAVSTCDSGSGFSFGSRRRRRRQHERTAALVTTISGPMVDRFALAAQPEVHRHPASVAVVRPFRVVVIAGGTAEWPLRHRQCPWRSRRCGQVHGSPVAAWKHQPLAGRASLRRRSTRPSRSCASGCADGFACGSIAHPWLRPPLAHGGLRGRNLQLGHLLRHESRFLIARARFPSSEGRNRDAARLSHLWLST